MDPAPDPDTTSWEPPDALRTDDVMVPHDGLRMRHVQEATRPRLRLNLTAMIDVVFLLLMYFLLIAEFRPREETFDMQLPARTTEAAAPDPFALHDAQMLARARWSVRPVMAHHP